MVQRRAACMVRERATDALVAAQVSEIRGLEESVGGKEAAVLWKL